MSETSTNSLGIRQEMAPPKRDRSSILANGSLLRVLSARLLLNLSYVYNIYMLLLVLLIVVCSTSISNFESSKLYSRGSYFEARTRTTCDSYENTCVW
jgi:hypothetical protein